MGASPPAGHRQLTACQLSYSPWSSNLKHDDVTLAHKPSVDWTGCAEGVDCKDWSKEDGRAKALIRQRVELWWTPSGNISPAMYSVPKPASIILVHQAAFVGPRW
uniref:Uncharacterized protein n=1 Tax=Coccidioides posadasii RMSCC 3488 TaxID=454284 RepID=A0A0J6FH43_COCPO|nr:hypothetical protein CPAG_04975 [Coccidioides posadasii RMSCC 3488]